MLNTKSRKKAIEIHQESLEKYKNSFEVTEEYCDELYSVRQKAVQLISEIEAVINTIVNTPKEFDKYLEDIKKEVQRFNETKKYIQESIESNVDTGVELGVGTAIGAGVANGAPKALLSLATAFGTTRSGLAISALSGAAAKNAAQAWIGRAVFAPFSFVNSGWILGGKVLAALNPIGWGISAVTTAATLTSYDKKNRKIVNEAVEEAVKIEESRIKLDQVNEEIRHLELTHKRLYEGLEKENIRINSYRNVNYSNLSMIDQKFFGGVVNKCLELSHLLNEQIRGDKEDE